MPYHSPSKNRIKNKNLKLRLILWEQSPLKRAKPKFVVCIDLWMICTGNTPGWTTDTDTGKRTTDFCVVTGVSVGTYFHDSTRLMQAEKSVNQHQWPCDTHSSTNNRYTRRGCYGLTKQQSLALSASPIQSIILIIFLLLRYLCFHAIGC